MRKTNLPAKLVYQLGMDFLQILAVNITESKLEVTPELQYEMGLELLIQAALHMKASGFKSKDDAEAEINEAGKYADELLLVLQSSKLEAEKLLAQLNLSEPKSEPTLPSAPVKKNIKDLN